MKSSRTGTAGQATSDLTAIGGALGTAIMGRLRGSGRGPAGIAALMITASAVAMISGSARADCQPSPATAGADMITCDATGADNSPYDALAGDDTVDIVDGVYGGLITGGVGNDILVLNGIGADVAAISGGAGNDVIDLLAGQVDEVYTFMGNDVVTLNGATVNTFITGGTGNDTIDLLSGSVLDVFGSQGTNTINLNGASVSGFITGGDGTDIINLTSGSANEVFGFTGDDTITLDGASVNLEITAGSGNDVIILLSGVAGSVAGFAGDDTITLDGASITGTIDGQADSDTIVLLSGLANEVDGGTGADTITLNGASITGFIFGGLDDGNDTILLLSGSAGDVAAEGGDDTVTLDGASIVASLSGGAGNDVIDLITGSVGEDVFGGIGDDTITLSGASIDDSIFGGDGSDVINLVGGQAFGAFGDAGADTLTLNGAALAGPVDGGDGADVIDLISGSAGSVTGGNGNDLITLSGASIGGDLAGGDGQDVISLLSGSVGGFVDGGLGADTITLNGAAVAGTIFGGLDDSSDTITLLSGSAFAVNGEGGNDLITLNDASITTDVLGGAGDDVIDLISGRFDGNLNGGDGSDTVTIAATYDLSTIAGNLDGGDDVTTTDGFVDLLTIQSSGTLTGENVINWEEIDVDGVTVTFIGNGLVTTGDADIGVGEFGIDYGLHAINGGVIDLDDGFAVTGNVFIDPDSTLVVATPDGTGVYSISGTAFMDGTVDMTGDSAATGDRLTVGIYDSLGAQLLMDAALDATEAGDLLVVTGDIFTNFGGGGVPTVITINDLGGAPAFTGTGPGNGIPIVDNSAGGAIVDGDFVLAGGEIVKTPFTYTLNLESDSILYLQSDVLAQVYGYAILSEVMRDEFPLLRDRLGEKRYGAAADPSLGVTDNAGIWARIDGTKRDIEHDGSETSPEWESSRAEAEVGIDIPVDLFGSLSVFGLSAHAVHGSASARSGLTPDPETAKVGTTGFGAGMSFTFFPGGGFYADLQGRLTAWDADVEVESRDIDEDVDGFSWGGSLEVGNRLSLGETTSVIPRGRAVYTDVDFSSFTDDDGVEVSQDDSASLVVEAGVTVEQLFPDNGVTMFLDASVAHDVLKDSSIDASGFGFESGLDDTWGTLQLGASAEVMTGTSAYLAADVGSPFGSNFGDSWSYGLEAGFRINF